MNTTVTRTIYTTPWPTYLFAGALHRNIDRMHRMGADTIVFAKPVSKTVALAHFEITQDGWVVIQMKGRRYFRFRSYEWPKSYRGEPLYIVVSAAPHPRQYMRRSKPLKIKAIKRYTI